MPIIVVGLGPGEQLTQEAREALAAAGRVYLRTRRHPAARSLPGARAFDSLLRRFPPPEALRRIVETLLAAGDGAVYATPGHPLAGEAVVAALRSRAEVRVVPGPGLREEAAQALGLDPARGLAMVDALDPRPDPSQPALVAHLSPTLAPSLQESLLQRYPAHHPVTLLSFSTPSPRPKRGTKGVRFSRPRTRTAPLAEVAALGRGFSFLYLPALAPGADPGAPASFRSLVARLRGPGGCPWDREQTHASLREFLLEETYEALEALDEGNPAKLQEELGDLLLQIVLHAQIAEETGAFTLSDVVRGISQKLVRRHPHVFGEVQVSGSGEVLVNWEKLKEKERGEGASLLASVPRALPALAYSEAIQARASRVGFEWPRFQGILDKIAEELRELHDVRDQGHRVHELGDILFAVVDAARWLEVDLETALRQANQRFFRRFRHMEESCLQQGRRLSELTMDEQNALWEEAKLALGDRETP